MEARISIVIPCYNEEAVLTALYERLGAVVAELDYEVILVDDGSGDATWEMIEAHGVADARWKGVRLSRNFGHQTAVSAGMRVATGAAVCVMDADLQDPPEVLLEFIDQWRSGVEVVYGVRRKRQDKSVKKLLAWGFYRTMARMSQIQIPLDAGDFCLMDRKVVEVMNAMPERNRYLRGLRVWCGYRHEAVEFDRDARLAGEPCYTFRKSLQLALDGIFSFSTLPLSLASHLGVIVSVVAFVGAVFTFLQRVFPEFFARFGLEPGPGYATIVISILFLGGVQLICLGILGAYLGRIYEEVQGRPQWVVQERVNLD